MSQKIRFSGKSALVAAVVAVALGLALMPPAALSAEQSRILGIVLVTLSLWGTGVVPGYLASLIFFAVVLILGLAPAELVFQGFGSTATWLIVSGFVIGAAITVSGLGRRLAEFMGPVLTHSYPRLIGGLMLVAMALGFVMPSSLGRAVVLVPIGMALAERCGFGRGSNGRIGIAAVLAIGCNMPSFAILPSNIPNMILAGGAETIYGTHFGYTEYLALHYPVLGIVKSALAVIVVLWLFPDRIGAPLDTEAVPGAAGAAGPVDRFAQLRTSAILLVTLCLWMTDSLHGVSPAWVGLGAAVLLLLPGIGVVTPPAFKSSVDFGMLLFVVGALALGALVNASGLGAMIGRGLAAALPLGPGRDFANFLSLTGMGMVTGLFTTIPGVPAVLTPLAQDLSELTGFGLETVLMTQVVAFSTVVLPYQAGPLVVAMQLSGERLGHLAKATVSLSLLTLLLLLPLDYLWWRLLGWF
ncbi:SLC13 family permease [Salipiger sp. P9]|uniref:SLC13 family permease n=1 Tax=Salipiger pentaromativorans TaxID=2943193 RepID=UPI0021578378|nr:SLC13 family permease [Salipiger pentaromativorans]MCR8549835.1 SLC13 family permease [Salipiger pentaromativorans]